MNIKDKIEYIRKRVLIFATIGVSAFMLFYFLPAFVIWYVRLNLFGDEAFGFIGFQDKEFLSRGFWGLVLIYFSFFFLGAIVGVFSVLMKKGADKDDEA